ncbi:hypothetical protein ACX1C1_17075 [Paenibacillus sp. strain BS8-2]
MRRKFKLTSQLLLLVGALLLAGCSGQVVNSHYENNLQDGDNQLTEEMNEIISDHIIQKYATIYQSTEKQFEVHGVYGTNESDGVITVYMWSYFGGFNQSTGLDTQVGHSLPAVIQLSEKEGTYSVLAYTEAEDGNSYQPSIEKMFPSKYLRLVRHSRGIMKDLKKEMDEKVNAWLVKKS